MIPRSLPRLYDSADDLAFDDEDDAPPPPARPSGFRLAAIEDDDEIATLPGVDTAANGIRAFFETVVRELEDTETGSRPLFGRRTS